jgi:hypothetical protein
VDLRVRPRGHWDRLLYGLPIGIASVIVSLNTTAVTGNSDADILRVCCKSAMIRDETIWIAISCAMRYVLRTTQCFNSTL